MRKPIKRMIALALTAVILFALLASCSSSTKSSTDSGAKGSAPAALPSLEPVIPGSGSTRTDNPDTEKDKSEAKYGGILKISKAAAPPSLFNLHKASKSGYVDYCVETLGKVDRKTYTATPFLAKSFEEDPKAKTITIKLNEGIMFHDGSELTGEVVKWNFDTLIANGRGSSINSPSAIECTDKYTVVVKYDEWVLGSVNVLSRIGIYSQKAFEEHGLDYCSNHPVGTGPFVFESYVADNKITYTRNDKYWQDGLPYLDGVEVYIMTDQAATMTAFVNGDIDFMQTGSQNYIQQLNGYGCFNKSEPGFDDYSGFAFAPNANVADSPWSNPQVRKAVMHYGINDVEIAALTGGSSYIPFSQMALEGSLAYNDAIPDKIYYDLDKAKEMLTEAGYPDGFKTDLLVSSFNTHIATALQEALKRLNIEVNVIEINTADPRRSDGVTPGLFCFNFSTAWDLIPTFARSLNQTIGTSMGKNIYYSDEFQALFEKAQSATTYDERSEYSKQMVYQFLIEDCSYRQICISNANIFINDRIRGGELEGNYYLAHDIWVEK